MTEEIHVMQTPSGTRFGVLGTRVSSPAPTLFVFVTNIEDSLTVQTCNEVRKRGYLCVSLDLPFHQGPGSPALPPNSPEGLSGWAVAIRNGEAMVPEFVSKVSQVLGYLIREGYTDPQKAAVAGISRGAFVAMHVAAADPRFQYAVGFAPVTDLTELGEFAELKDNQLARSLSLAGIADKLAGRPLWVSIGNNDARVGTDKAIEFTRKVVAASVAGKTLPPTEVVDVELHVMPWPGHGGDLLRRAYDAGAAWLLDRAGENAGT